MATTAQIDDALTVLRATRAKLALAIEAHARAVLVESTAAANVILQTALESTAQGDMAAAKAALLLLLAEIEV